MKNTKFNYYFFRTNSGGTTFFFSFVGASKIQNIAKNDWFLQFFSLLTGEGASGGQMHPHASPLDAATED